MNILSQHIKTLLLTHDHVSLPRFGTFFADTIKTKSEENVFMPMRRELQFTPDIDDNDDTLLHSIASTYHLTTAQAQRRLDKEIDDAGRTLASTGTLDFDTLGTFCFNGGRITFEKCKQSLVVPTMYGLDAISMSPLQRLTDEHNKSENYIIRLNRRTVHTAACIAATILMLFMWGAPAVDIQRDVPQQTNMSSMFIPYINRPDFETLTAPDYICDPTVENITKTESETEENIIETDANALQIPSNSKLVVTEKATEKTIEKVAEKDAVKKGNEKATEKSHETTNEEKPFTLVLASSVTQQGAERYVEMLKKAGCSEARVMTRGNMTRVVYSGYDTHDEAVKAREQMRQVCKDFSDSWILKI